MVREQRRSRFAEELALALREQAAAFLHAKLEVEPEGDTGGIDMRRGVTAAATVLNALLARAPDRSDPDLKAWLALAARLATVAITLSM